MIAHEDEVIIFATNHITPVLSSSKTALRNYKIYNLRPKKIRYNIEHVFVRKWCLYPS